MKYMGSKARLMKDLKPIIESYITDKTVAYIEPFAGGMNSMCKIDFHNKIANDNNKYLIAMWISLVKGVRFNHYISREDYSNLRLQYRGVADFGYSDAEIGWYGFVGSYNGRFFDGGYSGVSSGRDYIAESSRNIERQIPSMIGTSFLNKCYTDLYIPNGSVVYCDIPYKNTTGYMTSTAFNYDEFYEWCNINSKHSTILISEFNMPKDNFMCIWEKGIKTQIGLENKHDKIERLFTPY